MATYNVPPAPAHMAAADAAAAVYVIRAMAEGSKGLKFRTPEELHALQIEWRRGQQESLSEHLKEKHGTGIDSREMGWPIYEA